MIRRLWQSQTGYSSGVRYWLNLRTAVKVPVTPKEDAEAVGSKAKVTEDTWPPDNRGDENSQPIVDGMRAIFTWLPIQ